MSTIFTFKTSNPTRNVVVKAADRAEADTKFAQMRDASGLTAESVIESVTQLAIPANFDDSVGADASGLTAESVIESVTQLAIPANFDDSVGADA